MFNHRLGMFEQHCTCCQSTGDQLVSVETTCTDGTAQYRTVSVPVSCSCELCTQPDDSTSQEIIDVDKPSVNAALNSNTYASGSVSLDANLQNVQDDLTNQNQGYSYGGDE